MTEHKEVEIDLILVRNNLKQGDYDGVDIMRAWLAIDELLTLRKAFTNATTEYAQLKADAEIVKAMQEGYSFSCNEPCDYLTDEYNESHRWHVRRTMRPFCGKDSIGVWSGKTANEALSKAREAIDQARSKNE